MVVSRSKATATTYNSGELSTRATQATQPMVLVPSKVIVRSVDAIPPLKFPYFKFKPAVFNGFRLLSGPAMTYHQRRALLRRHEHQTRRCGCYRRHTRRTPLPRPIMAADLGPNVSAAAAAACMSAGGRVWWWAVSRSRTPTTRCRAGACANGIIPGVCGRALDNRGRGCVGDGLLQRRDDRRKRTHERKAGPAE